MVLRYETLEAFYKNLCFSIYPEHEIQDQKITCMIGKRFGVSRHIRRNILRALQDFGLIRLGELGRWEVRPINGWEQKDKDDAEQILKEKIAPPEEQIPV